MNADLAKNKKAKEPRNFVRFIRDFFKFGVFVTPPIIIGIEYLTGSHDSLVTLLEDSAWSLLIGEIVLFCCLGGAYCLAMAEETFYELKGWSFNEHPDYVHVIRSALFVVPGMYVAFRISDEIHSLAGQSFEMPDIEGYKFGIIISVLIMLIHSAWGMQKNLKKMATDHAELEKENLKSQVKALSAQMNPHLLFNALNSVASTIQSDPDAAEDMTIELSHLYRKILAATKQDSHTISEELEICRLYLQIEKIRFTGRLQFDLPKLEQCWQAIEIPSLLIQPLVENAIKHGIAPKAEGGRVKIWIDDLPKEICICIEDDGVGYGKSKNKGSETSLENCQRRLEYSYKARANFEIKGLNPGTRVSMTIPKDSDS